MQEIVEKSFFNCHCKGLHSIMLLEGARKTIRLFVADIGNEMKKNYPDMDFLPRKDMSIAFHPHHCNITIDVIKGEIFNWIIGEDARGFRINKYFYKSEISNGKIGFEFLGDTLMATKSREYISQGQSAYMEANLIHTVACDSKELTAWLVYEGKEDYDYHAINYSNNDLAKFNSDGLYKKPTELEITSLLELVFDL